MFASLDDRTAVISDIISSAVGIADQPANETTGVVVIRHGTRGVPAEVSKLGLISERRIGVINAGDGLGEDPTEALAYIHTVRKKVGNLKNLTFLLIGDAKFNPVGRSLLFALQQIGSTVQLLTVPKLVPLLETPVKVFSNFMEIVEAPDIIITLPVEDTFNDVEGTLPALSLTALSLHRILNQQQRRVIIIPCRPTMPNQVFDPAALLGREEIDTPIESPTNLDAIAVRMSALQFVLNAV